MEVTASAAADGDAAAAKGPPPPPSPLTGCYLLIVIAEPHSDDHKDIILQRIAKGIYLLFLFWILHIYFEFAGR